MGSRLMSESVILISFSLTTVLFLLFPRATAPQVVDFFTVINKETVRTVLVRVHYRSQHKNNIN